MSNKPSKSCSLSCSFTGLKRADSFWRDPRLVGLVGMIGLGVILRWLPHPPNVSPVTGIALFAGAYVSGRSRVLSIVIPLAILFLSDLWLGFHESMLAVYFSFALVAMLGWFLRTNRSVLRIGGATLAGSLLFFFITNFAVWWQSGLYGKTWSGLVTCYMAALPFLENALAGDVIFTASMFGAWALLERTLPQMREA